MGKRKHFYFSSKYQKVLEHIESKENESQYIIDLVLMDIKKAEKGIDSEIIDYINARLNNLQIKSNDEQSEEKTNEQISISVSDIEDFF